MQDATLFDEKDLRPVEVVELTLAGPTLRCVYWEPGDDNANDRVCLVRCDGGERNVRSVRRLSTLCGITCKEVARTSAVPPAKQPYCQACVTKAGSGVLR